MRRVLPFSGKPHKFGAKKCEIDGHRFDSKAEGARFVYLKRLASIGEVFDLELQPRFDIVVNGTKVCAYVADFRYRNQHGQIVVEDVKSGPTKTPLYRLKAKLVRAALGVEIVEVM